MKKAVVIFAVLALMLVPIFAEEVGPFYDQPIFITSAGQSPSALQMSVLARAVQLTHVFERVLSAEEIDMSDIGTVIIVAGASGKGLGAAGIDTEVEIARVLGIVEKAKESEIPVILVQLEGAPRRGPSSDQIVEALIPFTDFLIVKLDADEDGFFTDIHEEHEIPILFFERTNDVREILRNLFL